MQPLETSSATDTTEDEEDVRLEALGARGVFGQRGVGFADDEMLFSDDIVDDDDFRGIQETAANNVTVLRGRLKEAKRECRHYQQEARLHKEESDRLRRREVEMMALSTQLHHRFQSLQLQVDGLKGNIRMHLLDPVTDAEYRELEALPEAERDLMATLRIGIYQQIGSLRAARDTAVRRASEVAVEFEALTARHRQTCQELADMKLMRENDDAQFKRQLSTFEHRASHVAELTGKVQDLEAKLKSAYVDQEQVLQAKLTLSSKINELGRVQMQLKEAESNVERFKSDAECSEQKLDILKSEFYDLRLKYTQRVSELESHVKVCEERLRSVEDLETEAEAFLSNIAASTMGDEGGSPQGQLRLAAMERYAAVPTSRKTMHAVTVTRRCLQLDNQLTLCRTELRRSEERCARLERSLEMCRAALSSQHAPFALAEEAMDKLTSENAELVARQDTLRTENELLHAQVAELRADLDVMARHRGELVRIRDLLRQMGAQLPSDLSGPNAAAAPSAVGAHAVGPMASFASVSSASSGGGVAQSLHHRQVGGQGLPAAASSGPLLEMSHNHNPLHNTMDSSIRISSPKFGAGRGQSRSFTADNGFGRELDGSVAAAPGMIEIF